MKELFRNVRLLKVFSFPLQPLRTLRRCNSFCLWVLFRTNASSFLGPNPTPLDWQLKTKLLKTFCWVQEPLFQTHSHLLAWSFIHLFNQSIKRMVSRLSYHWLAFRIPRRRISWASSLRDWEHQGVFQINGLSLLLWDLTEAQKDQGKDNAAPKKVDYTTSLRLLLILTRRTDGEPEAPILWPPEAKSWLTGKDLDAGENWGQEEKGSKEEEMVGWHHWLNGQEFEQTLGDSEV